MSKIQAIVVHYSATYADQNLTVKDIDKMHRDRGWSGVGYHWVIRRDGIVEQGRPESRVGAHVGGQNAGKIGICCIGGLDRATGPNKGVDNRTSAQIESLIKLIRECLKRYPGAKVVGHRDLASTQCPGFDVQTWWAKVQKKKAPAPTPVSPSAPAKTGYLSEDKEHTVEKGETWFGIAQEHGLSLDKLLAWNDADANETLVVGRVLRLTSPTKPIPAPSPQPTPPAAPAPVSGGLLAWLASILKAIIKGGR